VFTAQQVCDNDTLRFLADRTQCESFLSGITSDNASSVILITKIITKTIDFSYTETKANTEKILKTKTT